MDLEIYSDFTGMETHFKDLPERSSEVVGEGVVIRYDYWRNFGEVHLRARLFDSEGVAVQVEDRAFVAIGGIYTDARWKDDWASLMDGLKHRLLSQR